MLSMRAKNFAGFTLLELMVTLVIVSVLAAISVPYYDSFTRKSRRTEGINALVQVASLQERWFTENGTYTTNLSELGLDNASSNTTENGFYQFGLVAGTIGCAIIDCFVLEARPAPGTPHADDNFWYRISSDGLRQTFDVDAGSWSNGWD